MDVKVIQEKLKCIMNDGTYKGRVNIESTEEKMKQNIQGGLENYEECCWRHRYGGQNIKYEIFWKGIDKN